MDRIEESWDCDECGPSIQAVTSRDCIGCGEGMGVEQLIMTLLGIDVEAMFPSLQSESTGRVVRWMILRSGLNIQGFDWMQAVRYIKINQSLTGDLASIQKYLPRTKSGRTIGMANIGVNSKKENIRDQWIFSDQIPSEDGNRCQSSGNWHQGIVREFHIPIC